ncbi:FAD binding domain-containing protein [Caldovatus aquaticus]|uniref:FAD binding domain-containing protein n=1 Tax=Caldovatus aquaticus TaxID=2865671 RepID=A0ABS7EX97_9PROT|nr:FAD binding domain-containing protein [Caldovatus aquaticus]MBW8267977.1 FAD binding domain-containing protein [Caldovatus aquaticus]
MPLPSPRRALIAGGSMAGLIAAHLLLRRGWDVQVFERVEAPLTSRGAGIVTHPALWRALEACGLDPTRDLGVAVRIRRVFGRDGRLLGERECPQVFTAWDRLFRLLRDAFPDARYHAGQAVEEVAQDADRVRARINGETVEAALLVGADGIRSTVRGLLLPEAQPRYAGYVGWRGLIAEAALPPAVHADLFEGMCFCLPPGEQMVGYPVAGPDNDLRPGHRRYNTVWYRPADEASELPALLTDETGRQHEGSIPPPLIARATVAAMREAAERLLAPQFATLVRLTPQPFLQPIYDLESPRMALGRVALIGDAAFVARPHVGAGVTKAAEDAEALAAALDAAGGDVPAALARFEAARLPRNRRVIERARELGRCIAAAGRPADETVREPSVLMRDIAVVDFLDAA